MECFKRGLLFSNLRLPITLEILMIILMRHTLIIQIPTNSCHDIRRFRISHFCSPKLSSLSRCLRQRFDCFYMCCCFFFQILQILPCCTIVFCFFEHFNSSIHRIQYRDPPNEKTLLIQHVINWGNKMLMLISPS